MIDETLSRLSRALIAASDKLTSDDFLKRQAELVEIEAQQDELAEKRAALAESLEADEAAVVAAQEALQAHFAGSATPAAPEPETPADDFTETVVGIEQYFHDLRHTQADEFSSSRANGAYPED